MPRGFRRMRRQALATPRPPQWPPNPPNDSRLSATPDDDTSMFVAGSNRQETLQMRKHAADFTDLDNASESQGARARILEHDRFVAVAIEVFHNL